MLIDDLKTIEELAEEAFTEVTESETLDDEEKASLQRDLDDIGVLISNSLVVLRASNYAGY